MPIKDTKKDAEKPNPILNMARNISLASLRANIPTKKISMSTNVEIK